MGLLYNSVANESLSPGDHIYSWESDYVHANHGIFVGENTVVHFTPAGAGTQPRTALPVNCPHYRGGDGDGVGVVSSCLACFHSGSVLYRVEYSSPDNFRETSSVLATSDPPQYVVRRANHLLEEGAGCYNVFKNNREDFSIFCKAGSLVLDLTAAVPSIVGGPLLAVLYEPWRRLMVNRSGMVAVYWNGWTLYSDEWKREAVGIFSAEDLTWRLGKGRLTIVESEITVNPILRQIPAGPLR